MSNTIYLAHHGIKGQKWYVRRYQNEDGTLTEAGKKRYGVDGDSLRRRKLTKDIVKSLNLADSEKAKYKIKKEGYVRSETDRMYSTETYDDIVEAVGRYTNDIQSLLNLAQNYNLKIKDKDIVRSGYTQSQEYKAKMEALNNMPITAIMTTTPGKTYKRKLFA